MSPAAISPVTGRVAGASSAAPATSAAWTAYPSMLELSKDGRATAAVTSSASTQPSASASSRLAGASGVIAARIAAWYASTDVSEPGTATSGVVPCLNAALRGTCGARG